MAGFTNLPPQPPEDPDVRNIVDKLANFVARNGHEFEQMTMDKQRNNPKFAFLFGGEYHAYYKWKVAMEQGIFFTDHSHSASAASHPQSQSMSKGLQMGEAPETGGGAGQEGAGSGLVDRLVQVRQEQQTALEQQGMIDVYEEEFVKTVKPLMDSCTKDAIASGKSWILSHTTTPEECNKMAHFLMRRTLDSPVATFSQKLHVVYLINDLLFHCQRKGSADLQKAIEASIVQIFFNVRAGQSDESKDKLAKVLNIWEGQAYFSPPVLEQIHEVLEKCGSVPEVKQQPPPSTPEPPPLMQGGDPPPLMSQPLPLPPPWQGKGDSMWKPPPLMEKPPWGPPPEGTPWQPPAGESPQPPLWHQPLPTPDQPAWMKNEQPETNQQQQPPPWQQRDSSERPNLPPWQQGDTSERSNLVPWQQGDSSERPNLAPWQQGDSSERSNLASWQQGETNERSNLPPWQQGEPRLKPPPWHSSDTPPWQQGPPPRLPLPPWMDPRDGPPLHPPFDGFPPPPPDWRDGSLPPFPPRGPPHGDPDSFRGPPPHDHRGPPPHDRRGPPPHDHRGPPPDHRAPHSHDHRGPPPLDHRGPPPHDHRGPPSHDHRGPPHDYQGPPLHDHRALSPHDHRDSPPHDHRGPPHDQRDRHDHRAPHDHRDPPPRDHRGPPPRDQRDPPPHDHRGPSPRDQRDPPPHDHRVPPSVDEEPQMPSIPYFDLPAGLMVPLVPFEEHGYKPIDPMLVRLPHPQPPSKRLLEAVEEFYAAPSDDRPRNEEGWEAKALLTFFDKKLKAKHGRAAANRQSRRRSRSKSHSRSRSRSSSRSHSESRSRSHSPRQRRSRSRSSSRSRSHSRSPSPQRRRSRSRSRSPFLPTVPSRRSPSPERPTLGVSTAERIPEGNVGHQMLRRMGWEGTGLGSSHQGIQEPVHGGDVRDKGDKYKGVGGIESDSFSQFRKRKSYVYNRQPPPRLGQS